MSCSSPEAGARRKQQVTYYYHSSSIYAVLQVADMRVLEQADADLAWWLDWLD